MARMSRVEIEGGVFRFSDCFASGEVVFSGPHEAAELIATIQAKSVSNMYGQR